MMEKYDLLSLAAGSEVLAGSDRRRAVFLGFSVLGLPVDLGVFNQLLAVRVRYLDGSARGYEIEREVDSWEIEGSW
jgi:hypothetical protein